MTENPSDRNPTGTATTLLLPAPPPSPDVEGMTGEALQRRVAAAAKCAASADDAIWFPAAMLGHSAQAKYAAHARVACLGCAVIEECLELALRAEDVNGGGSHGVRGAAAPWQRQMMIRSRRLARTAAVS